MVHPALHELPRMFQIWACKQVMGVAGKNLYQSKYRTNNEPMCPSCTRSVESFAHVLECPEEGRFETLFRKNRLLRQLDEKDRHRQRFTELPNALHKRKGSDLL